MLSGRREPVPHFFLVKILGHCCISEWKGIKHMMLKANLSSEGDHSVEMLLVHAEEKVGGLQWSLGYLL